ncbi:nucleotide exchange factor GrpE [Marisediminicola senii]|uniref:nucleotide exchange factor GrpE n=1 Tax=Marisediminicola senii TaxID=2711233 RepID=UPI001F2737F2|nr:nucleotide exchange factor GrpE [Marisediminicola senii]
MADDSRNQNPDGEPDTGASSGEGTDASTGVPADAASTAPSSDAPVAPEPMMEAEDADVETSMSTPPPPGAEALSDSDQSVLDAAQADLVGEMRNEMLRAKADLVNFRTRVERDRAANREGVIAEVVRTLLPAMDDLTRAEKHGDLEGSPLALVAQKLRGGFEKYGLRLVGETGEPFDPNFHEALVQLPSPDVTVNTIADVIEPGYALGDRLIRAAKVAVHVPAE